MRHITRRADSQPSTYWMQQADGTRVPEHVVTPDERGWFNVLSNHSGLMYRVDTDGQCRRASGEACPRFNNAGTCSHLAAVLEHARRVLGR